jgi:hypothetical protein
MFILLVPGKLHFLILELNIRYLKLVEILIRDLEFLEEDRAKMYVCLWPVVLSVFYFSCIHTLTIIKTFV